MHSASSPTAQPFAVVTAPAAAGQAWPQAYPRRVLVMAVGLTPQVLTETLYALAVTAKTPWVPTEIHLITTAEGAHRARLSLLEGGAIGGHFHQLCQEYGLAGIAFDASHIHVVKDAQGHDIQDMRSEAENTRAADDICAHVGRFCNDPHASVHVSIAGGRKTMGYYLGYALSLFGREQDRLSHVLVNAPFESLPDFYYPPRQPRVLIDRNNRPVKTDEAEITLAEIPFVRLREGLPTDVLSGERSFALAVSAANDRALPRVVLLRDQRIVRLGRGGHQIDVEFAPREWAWYALYCQARVEGWGTEGLLAGWPDVRLDALRRHYESVSSRVLTAKGALSHLESVEKDIQQADRDKISQINNAINKTLTKALGREAAPYRIVSETERRARSKYRVNGLKGVPASEIQLPAMR
jgi:CRISPR-associated protein (TIGR02584 family)